MNVLRGSFAFLFAVLAVGQDPEWVRLVEEGNQHRTDGRLNEAGQAYEVVLGRLQELGDQGIPTATVLNNLGLVRFQQGRYANAA